MSEESELSAYCGLHCGDCPFHRGRIADLARDLRKEMRQAKCERLAGILGIKDYAACYESLGNMVKRRCKSGCRNGGGNPMCKIRLCAQKKGYEGCWQCPETEACAKLKFLEPDHLDAHLKNLRQIQKIGMEKWIASGKRRW